MSVVHQVLADGTPARQEIAEIETLAQKAETNIAKTKNDAQVTLNQSMRDMHLLVQFAGMIGRTVGGAAGTAISGVMQVAMGSLMIYDAVSKLSLAAGNVTGAVIIQVAMGIVSGIMAGVGGITMLQGKREIEGSFEKISNLIT